LPLNLRSERWRWSDAIFQLRLAAAARAMDATENFSPLFHAVPNDPTVAVRANWRERMDRALEAVKGVVLIGNDYLKRLVIFIFANFASSHT
jgi:hypothetical protein